jgi:hypothetical protein
MTMPCGKMWRVHVTEEHNARQNLFLNSYAISRHKEHVVMVSVFSERQLAEMMRIIQT